MSTDIEYNGVTENDTQLPIESETTADRPKTFLASKSSKSFLGIAPPSPPKRGDSTRISLSDIPPELAAKLKHLDLGNDGFLDVEDILVLDEAQHHDKKTVKYHFFLIFIQIIYFTYVNYYNYYNIII